MFGIDDSVMVPAAMSLAGSLFGSESQAESASAANYANWQNNEANRQWNWAAMKDAQNFQVAQTNSANQWQDYFRNTAMQSRVKDLQAAGLNPILAISGVGSAAQGASSAGGVAASNMSTGGSGQVGTGPGWLGGAAHAMEVVSAIQALSKSKADQDLVAAQADKVRSETMEKGLNTAVRAAELGLTEARGGREVAEAERTRVDTSFKRGELEAMGERGIEYDEDKMTGFQADVLTRKANMMLKELGIPEARASSQFFSTDFGAANPYVQQMLMVLRGLSSAGAFRR